MKKPEQVYTTLIRSTPEKVWAAITTPEFTRQYWIGNSNVSDWKPGSAWKHVSGDDGEVLVVGTVVECVSPRRLVLTWADPDKPDERSRVTFEIEPEGDLVCLRVVHGDFAPESAMPERVAWGWPRVLSSLKSLLETGRALPITGCKRETA